MLHPDVKSAFRMISRNPGPVAAVVVSLALAVGGSTGLFSVADALFFRDLPVERPEDLIILVARNLRTPERLDDTFSFPMFASMRRHAAPAGEVFAAGLVGVTKAILDKQGDEPEDIHFQWMSGNAFTTLGVKSAAGRLFSERSAGEVVISYGFWQRRFGQTSDITGRSIRCFDRSFRIAGVMDPAFFGTEVGRIPDVWLRAEDREPKGLRDRSWSWLRLFARRQSSFSDAQLDSMLHNAYDAALSEDTATVTRGAKAGRLVVLPGRNGTSTLRNDYRRPVMLLAIIVGLVVLTACVNVTHILLSLATARRSDIALRRGLGATRIRIAGLVLYESAILAALGSAGGFFVGRWSTNWLVALVSAGDKTFRLSLPMDMRVMLFSVAVCLFVALTIGLWPSLRATRIDATSELMRRAGTVSVGVVSSGGRWVLIFAQVCLSFVLVYSAILFNATLENLKSLQTGFDRKKIVLAEVEISGQSSPEQLRAQWSNLVSQIQEIPGVTAAAVSNWALFGRNYWWSRINVPGESGSVSLTYFLSTSPGYFRTMGTAFLHGRDFSQADLSQPSPAVAIVNEAFVRTFLRGEPAVGRRFSLEGSPAQVYEIVGVVENVRYDSLRAAPPCMAYFPLNKPGAEGVIQLRADLPFSTLSAALKQKTESAMTGVRLKRVTPQETLLNDTMFRERLLAQVGSFFGVLALVMAATGVYGVVRHSVSGRIREIGLRAALGATPDMLRKMVIRECLAPVLGGIAIGSLLTISGTRYLEPLLFEIEPANPLLLSSAVMVILLAALLAAAVPANNASKLDPARALRHE